MPVKKGIVWALAALSLAVAPLAAEAASLKLTWTDVAGEEKYLIRRKISPATTYTQINEVAANATQYIDDGNGFGQFTAGATYCYQVIAWSSVGQSAPAEACVTIPSAPATPSDLSAVFVP